LSLVLAAGITAAVTISPSGFAGAASGSGAPGVTPHQITLGLVTSITGAASSNFTGAVQGAQARIDLQNAEGGVDGRKINLVVGDDQTSFTAAQTAVNSLIQTHNAFGLIFISDLVAIAYRTAQQQGVPVVGFPTDGPEWGMQPNTNMVSTDGDQAAKLPANTEFAKVAKLEGATNMAVLAIANEPPSDVAAQQFVQAANAIGLKVGYQNFDLPLGSVNVTAAVLAMKQAGVDGFDSLMLSNTNFAVMEGAKQAGLTLKAPIQAVGYDQALINDPSAVQAGQGGIFSVFQVPVEEKTPATLAEQAAFKKYEHFTGVPNLNWTQGWISADLWINGLKAAGKNPTRGSFLKAVRSIKGYTAEGLLPLPLNLSLKDFGKNPTRACSYFVKLKGTTFVPLNHGKPICGNNVA
jgi:branched-chain amino acid transport system substrate-binding protein